MKNEDVERNDVSDKRQILKRRTGMKSKIKRITMSLMAMVFALNMAMPVSAANNQSWHFEGNNKGSLYTLVQSAGKSDAEKKWYISLDKSYGGKNNTLSPTNIFQCKTYKGDAGVSGNHRFSNYVNSYGVAYNSNASLKKGDKITFKGGKAYKSTSTETLRISGRFAP